MKFHKPNFWQTNNLISISLLPISIVVKFLTFCKKKLTRKFKFKIKVICVGNIYIGGTGKTPLSIFLAHELSLLGKKPVIVKKFYKEHRDEHDLISEKFSNLILNKNRFNAIEDSIQNKFDTVIMDDGFQDYKIEKDLSILCFNQNQLIGNGKVFPAGPLREDLSSIKNAQIIIINGEKNLSFEEKLIKLNNKISIFYTLYKPRNIDEFKNKKLFAVAGIGNPDNFFKLIVDNKLVIEKKLAFPDHYPFRKSEILNIINEAKEKNLQVLVTEKDYYRIQKFGFKEVKFLKVDVEIKNKDKFLKKIISIYEKNI
tara:strand:+ start:1197 stop:2135 length:939 start_codon:yes stop_codon:yes gene_type:complete